MASIEFPCDFIQSSNDSAIPIRVPTIMQPPVRLITTRSNSLSNRADSSSRTTSSHRKGLYLLFPSAKSSRRCSFPPHQNHSPRIEIHCHIENRERTAAVGHYVRVARPRRQDARTRLALCTGKDRRAQTRPEQTGSCCVCC
jgi:hypothetical protein